MNIYFVEFNRPIFFCGQDYIEISWQFLLIFRLGDFCAETISYHGVNREKMSFTMLYMIPLEKNFFCVQKTCYVIVPYKVWAVTVAQSYGIWQIFFVIIVESSSNYL